MNAEDYQKKIIDEFERLSNLPNQEIVLTEEQIKNEIEHSRKVQRIEELKKLLSSQDYKTIKYMQGELTEDEFLEVKAQCKIWRDAINALEASL